MPQLFCTMKRAFAVQCPSCGFSGSFSFKACKNDSTLPQVQLCPQPLWCYWTCNNLCSGQPSTSEAYYCFWSGPKSSFCKLLWPLRCLFSGQLWLRCTELCQPIWKQCHVSWTFLVIQSFQLEYILRCLSTVTLLPWEFMLENVDEVCSYRSWCLNTFQSPF